MDADLTIKIISAILAALTIGKIIYEIISGKSSKLREEYKFSKEFLSDLKNGTLHPYSIEKGYFALAGTRSIKKEEIEYILTLENSERCLRDYVLAQKYLTPLQTNGDLHIKFHQKYTNKWSRSWRKWTHGLLYLFFALIALSPIVLEKTFHLTFSNVLGLLLFTLPISGYLATDSIRDLAKIMKAERLVEGQKKHSLRIISNLNSWNQTKSN